MTGTVLDQKQFFRLRLDDELVSWFDSSANLWFGGYQFVSLAAALYQSENIYFQVNLGFLIFIVSGFLFMLYEYFKHIGRFDLRVAVFTFLRWYTAMLIGTAPAIVLWFILSVLISPFFGVYGVIWILFSLFLSSVILWAALMRLNRKLDDSYEKKILGFISQSSVGQDKDKEDLLLEITTKFTSESVIYTFLVFFFNLLVIIATIIGDWFYYPFLSAINYQPLLPFLLVFLIVLSFFSYRKESSKQIELIEEYESKYVNN